MELPDARVGIGCRQEYPYRQHRIGGHQGEGQVPAAVLPGGNYFNFETIRNIIQTE